MRYNLGPKESDMKKILLVAALAISLGVAVDLDGRIGMGLGWSPSQTDVGGILLPVTDIAVTRIGLGPKLSVEPIFQFTTSDMEGIDMYFKLYCLGNYVFKSHSKTNVYLKGGLGFSLLDETGGGDALVTFGVPFGFGLEYFCGEHWSVNFASLSGLQIASQGGTQTEIKFGNDKPFAFYFLFYY